MLGWFGQKRSDDGTVEGTTPYPSFGSPTEPPPPRQSTEKPPKRAFPTAFSTPHDAALSELQGTPSQPAVTEAPNKPPSFRSEVISPDIPESVRDEVVSPATRSENNLLGPYANTAALNASRIQITLQPELLLDPFDGMPLGVLVEREDNGDKGDDTSMFNLPSTFEGNHSNSHNVGSEAVWKHLSHILDLQSQISKKHFEMESIGTTRGNDAKKKSHKLSAKNVAEPSNIASGSATGLGLEDLTMPPGLNRPRQRAMSTVSTESSNDEPEGNEEGVNVPSEEAEKIRMREDEFAKLATQFEGRKEAINDIMGKLDELSKALSEFHNLPTPNIQFSGSRQNTVGVTSPPNATPNSRSMKEDGDTTKPIVQDTDPISNQAFDWSTRQNTGSPTLRPPAASSTAGGRDNAPPIIAIPHASGVRKRTVPTVLSNSKDPQASIHDSPASMGSLKLPQE